MERTHRYIASTGNVQVATGKHPHIVTDGAPVAVPITRKAAADLLRTLNRTANRIRRFPAH